MKRLLAASLAALIASSLAWPHGAKRWPAPAAAKKRQNPVPGTPESVQEGARLYQLHCLVCHGEKGDGHRPWRDKLPLDPADFTDRHMMSEMSDGEIFWKLSTGRELMPAFKDKLTPAQRWHLVNFLRTLAKEKPAEQHRD